MNLQTWFMTLNSMENPRNEPLRGWLSDTLFEVDGSERDSWVMNPWGTAGGVSTVGS